MRKIILFSEHSQQYLAAVPTEANGLGCAIWTPHADMALPLTLPEAEALSNGWPYLNNCNIYHAPPQKSGVLTSKKGA